MRLEDGEVGNMVGGRRQTSRNGGDCFLAHLASGLPARQQCKELLKSNAVDSGGCVH